jgi:hypothetical protein
MSGFPWPDADEQWHLNPAAAHNGDANGQLLIMSSGNLIVCRMMITGRRFESVCCYIDDSGRMLCFHEGYVAFTY